MKSALSLTALLALAVATVADDSDACEIDTPTIVKEAAVSTSSSAPINYVPVISDVNPANNVTEVYAPLPRPHLDRHDSRYVVPQKNVSCYYTANNTAEGHMDVNHTMKYPTVMLEQIASIINVDCTADSVAITFNDTTVFEKAQNAWASSSNKTIVLVTNHLGDCDAELERSFFLASSVTFDNSTLVATAGSTKANISTVATYTEISFGHIPAAAPNATAKRALVLDPSYTINPTLSLAENTVLFEYDPYVTVTADNASFTSDITFSGYLKYNWLLWKLEDLYFDIDAGFTADLALNLAVQAAYNTSFTYAPASLYYGVSVPGILELGPMLQFSVGTELSASAAAKLSTELKVGLDGGNVHLDVLNSANTGVSGWTPTYSATADINGQIEASVNPYAALTVEIAAKAFGGIIDLSTGLTAKPGFDNRFTLTGGVGVDLGGLKNITNTDCSQGLALNSNFTFALDAFATQWYSATLYEVNVPLLDECYSWA